MSRKTAIFLSGAGPGVGAGHVVRCIALAEALASENWSCTIALGSKLTAPLPFSVVPNIKILEPASITWTPDKLIERWPSGADLFVLDHYGLDASFERPLASWAAQRLVIDDVLVHDHECEALLCIAPPAAFPATVLHKVGTLLSGTNYALLRRQFWRRRLQQLLHRERPKQPKTVVVSLGGSSQVRSLEFVLLSLSSLPFPLRVKLVGPDADTVARELEARTPSLKIEPILTSDDMDILLSNADMAIGACGGSAWERAALAVPSVAFEIAENQHLVAAILRNTKAAIVLPPAEKATASAFARAAKKLLIHTDLARQMAQRAEKLVDALGAQRVLLHIAPEHATDGRRVSLRPARKGDCTKLYHWQHEPSTRSYSNNPEAPKWNEHRRWFRLRLDDPRCLLSIVAWGDEDAGVLRVDLKQHRGRPAGIVSLYLAPKAKGRGVGTAALRAVRRLVPDLPLDAEIDGRNAASLAAFRKAGYRQIDERWYCRDPDLSNESEFRV